MLVIELIISIVGQSYPLRLWEEWLLLVQVARWGKPVWLEEDPPRSGQAKLEDNSDDN